MRVFPAIFSSCGMPISALKSPWHNKNRSNPWEQKSWTNLIWMCVGFFGFFINPQLLLISSSHVPKHARKQPGGKILLKCNKRTRVVRFCSSRLIGGRAGWGLICRFPYLEYLKAIDVQHTHDLVPSFSLCLRGRQYGQCQQRRVTSGVKLTV